MAIIPNVIVTATATKGPIDTTNATAKQNIRKKIMKPVDDSIFELQSERKVTLSLTDYVITQMSRVMRKGLTFIGNFNLSFMKLIK